MRHDQRWKCVRILAMCAALPVLGQNSTNPGGIVGPSRVEANMGQIDFRLYNGPIELNEEVLHQFCPPGATTRRACYQEVLKRYAANGVSGVRFIIQVHHGLNYPAGTVNETWLAAFRNFLQDVDCGGDPGNCTNRIRKISIYLGWDEGPASQEYAPGEVQRPPAGNCGGTPIQKRIRFVWTSPWADECIDFRDGVCQSWKILDFDDTFGKETYDCSPSKPNPSAADPFVGWENVFNNFVGPMLGAVRDQGMVHWNPPESRDPLTLFELEVQNEIVLSVVPVRARLIVDNTRFDGQGNPIDVLANFRQRMQETCFEQGQCFDPGLVTYSNMDSNSRSDLPDPGCTSFYGDSPRIYFLSQTMAAIAAGWFGRDLQDPQPPDHLGCVDPAFLNQFLNDPPASGLIQLPYAHDPPKIADIHHSPCVYGFVGYTQGGVEVADCRQHDTAVNAAPEQARRFYDAVFDFLNSFGPGGWRCQAGGCSTTLYNATLVGDTFGHTVPGCWVSNSAGTPVWPYLDWRTEYPQYMIGGLRESSLRRDRNVVLRPWVFLQDQAGWHVPGWPLIACNPIVTNPPYSPSSPEMALTIPEDGLWPTTGSGSSGWFTLKANDLNGWADINHFDILFNSTLDITTGCYIRYDIQGSGVVATLGNGSDACLAGGADTNNSAGLTRVLNLSVDFQSGFAGPKTIWMRAQDAGSNMGAWLAKGAWTIPGSSCTYSLSPPSMVFPSIGGNGSVSVTTQAECAWTASSNEPWVIITSGGAGAGPGTVDYTVAGNTGAYRWAILTIAGQSHGVYQYAVPANLVLSPATLTSGTAWYQATNSITANTSSFIVSDSAAVTFKAGNVIYLRPEFRATAGSAPVTFRAFIGP